MEEINLEMIRGEWREENNGFVSGGNDTIESIKRVAEKINEIVEWINSHKDQLLN